MKIIELRSFKFLDMFYLLTDLFILNGFTSFHITLVKEINNSIFLRIT